MTKKQRQKAIEAARGGRSWRAWAKTLRARARCRLSHAACHQWLQRGRVPERWVKHVLATAPYGADISAADLNPNFDL